MAANSAQLGNLHNILTALIDGQPSEEQLADLEHLLSETPDALIYYRKYMRICAFLEFERSEVEKPQDAAFTTEGVLPRVVTQTQSPSPCLLSTTLPSTVGWFSSGWPVAYLIATVICGVGLLIGSHVYVSQPGAGRQAIVSAQPWWLAEPKTELVGRITGMVDCKWAGAASDSPDVPLGRKYELASGLMEITYDTGAKVILQGPVTYEVESANGGYLGGWQVDRARWTTASAKGFCRSHSHRHRDRPGHGVRRRGEQGRAHHVARLPGLGQSCRWLSTMERRKAMPKSCTRTNRPAWRSVAAARQWQSP